jgi:hypothetical protein
MVKKYDSTAARPVRVYQTPTKPISEYQESDWIDVVDEGIGPGSTGLPNKTRRQALINALEPWMRNNPNMELGFQRLVGRDPDARRFVFQEDPLVTGQTSRTPLQILSGAYIPAAAKGEEERLIREGIINAIARGEAPFHSSGLTQPGERYDPGDLPLGGGIATLGPRAFKGKDMAFYSPSQVSPWLGVRERREAGIPLGYPAEWESAMHWGGHELGHAGMQATRDFLNQRLRRPKQQASIRAILAELPPERGVKGTEEDYIRAVDAEQRSVTSKFFASKDDLRAEKRGLEAFKDPLSKKNPVQRESLKILQKYFARQRLYPPRRSDQRQVAR